MWVMRQAQSGRRQAPRRALLNTPAIDAAGYVQQQMPVDFQPVEELYCVRAVYKFNDPAKPEVPGRPHCGRGAGGTGREEGQRQLSSYAQPQQAAALPAAGQARPLRPARPAPSAIHQAGIRVYNSARKGSVTGPLAATGGSTPALVAFPDGVL